MREAGRRGASPAAGFTLIEMLVSFAIAAIMLGALYDVFSTGLRSVVAVQHYRDAVLLGESALDALANVTITAGDSSDHIGIYQRSTSITPRPDLLPAGMTASSVLPYQIDVRIDWRDGVRPRSIALATLRLAPPPQP